MQQLEQRCRGKEYVGLKELWQEGEHNSKYEFMLCIPNRSRFLSTESVCLLLEEN